MTKEQINNLVSRELPPNDGKPELVETHISWVLICDTYVYKIKKPIRYSFLDFSTLSRRKYYCEREIELNKRLTNDVYLDVLPVKRTGDKVFIDVKDGERIDYAVRMRKLDREKQMDVLLQNKKVTEVDIKHLAEKIAAFHKSTRIIYQKDISDVEQNFNDLEQERDYLNEQLGSSSAKIISDAMNTCSAFIRKKEKLLTDRLKEGFFRDCHGDLHSRNIFLLPDPQPFDCIEFNDDFREIDVLNEIAFLCMDLDAFNRKDLSDLFFNFYNKMFSAAKTDDSYRLFIYYKSYRANIRAKVNSLRARSGSEDSQIKLSLIEADKYLHLMEDYINILKGKP
jgi:aminoglycoside phosphotransferase family enzyme